MKVMNVFMSFMTAAVLAACSEHENTPTGSVGSGIGPELRWSHGCDFSQLFSTLLPAAKANSWAKDRYGEGLEIQFNIPRGDVLRDFVVVRQALDLVSDTIYAKILPTKGIETLVVNVATSTDDDLFDSSTIAIGGGRYHTTGSKYGLPESGEVSILIYEDELYEEYDNAEHIGSFSHWYLVFLHETFHVLGFGTSPKWDDLVEEKRRRRFYVCDREVRGSWDTGHWDLDDPGGYYPLMAAVTLSRVNIAPATWCALEGIGWDIRRKGEGVTRSEPDPIVVSASEEESESQTRLTPDPSTVEFSVDDPTWKTFTVHTDLDSVLVQANPSGSDKAVEVAGGNDPPSGGYCPAEGNDSPKRGRRDGYKLHVKACQAGRTEILLVSYRTHDVLQRYDINVVASQ